MHVIAHNVYFLFSCALYQLSVFSYTNYEKRLIEIICELKITFIFQNSDQNDWNCWFAAISKFVYIY